MCDPSCKTGDPYGTKGCGAREGRYGEDCRVCYNDVARAIKNDGDVERAIMYVRIVVFFCILAVNVASSALVDVVIVQSEKGSSCWCYYVITGGCWRCRWRLTWWRRWLVLMVVEIFIASAGPTSTRCSTGTHPSEYEKLGGQRLARGSVADEIGGGNAAATQNEPTLPPPTPKPPTPARHFSFGEDVLKHTC